MKLCALKDSWFPLVGWDMSNSSGGHSDELWERSLPRGSLGSPFSGARQSQCPSKQDGYGWLLVGARVARCHSKQDGYAGILAAASVAKCHSKQDGCGGLLAEGVAADLGFYAASSKAKDSWGSIEGFPPSWGIKQTSGVGYSTAEVSFLALFLSPWRVKVLTALVTGIRRGQEEILAMYTRSSIQEVERSLLLAFFSLPYVASNPSLLDMPILCSHLLQASFWLSPP